MNFIHNKFVAVFGGMISLQSYNLTSDKTNENNRKKQKKTSVCKRKKCFETQQITIREINAINAEINNKIYIKTGNLKNSILIMTSLQTYLT